jgi:hypothetical protein
MGSVRVDWEFLVKNKETGEAVWVVRGIPKDCPKKKATWIAVAIRQIQNKIVRIISKDMGAPGAYSQLAESLVDHGFEKVFQMQNGRVQWYKL